MLKRWPAVKSATEARPAGRHGSTLVPVAVLAPCCLLLAKQDSVAAVAAVASASPAASASPVPPPPWRHPEHHAEHRLDHHHHHHQHQHRFQQQQQHQQLRHPLPSIISLPATTLLSSHNPSANPSPAAPFASSPLARPTLNPFPVPGAAQPTLVYCFAIHVANPDRSGLDSPYKAAQSSSWPVLPAASSFPLLAAWLCSSPSSPLHNQACA
ncbi:hypothetical protein CDD82_295 [Ophiocordyceps australis]|uniref:Uncharacterized protein n=1 Tax=Ophiocordyceps australis TaxID=1399860 RepID=A0A2C5YPB7_9HYPO|nr:hypothetical protein CDD82_295 [Ophiocordyceps australis]